MFLTRQFQIGFQIALQTREPVLRRQQAFQLFAFLQDSLRLFRVLPEIGLADAAFQFRQPCAVAFGVKGSSAPARCGAGALRSGVAGLRESWCRLQCCAGR
jgi:hypothetical protein